MRLRTSLAIVFLAWVAAEAWAQAPVVTTIAASCSTGCPRRATSPRIPGPRPTRTTSGSYETTLAAARFNNTGTQTTVPVFQNPGTEPVSLTVSFWGADGTLVATYAPAVAHDAPYGRLLGKAVAVEPSTGFSFDTPLQPKPR